MSNFNSILGEIRNILRKDGITNMDSVNHCVAFYILRAMNNELCEKLSIPKQYIFDTFDKDENGKPLDTNKLFAKFYTPSNIDNVDETGDYCFVYYLLNVFNMNEIGEYKLKKAMSFKEIFELLKKLDVAELNKTYDIVGLIYENHLATGSTNARDLGQFFTHRKVIKYMIELCEPKIKPSGEIESILDPTMGTGGFLTMAAKYLNNKYDVNWEMNSKFIYGCDIDDRLKTLASLNMLLETGEIMPNLINLDTLHNGFRFQDVVLEKFDIILANEPFGLKNIIYKEVCERIKELKINGTKAEPLFLQLMMISLKENGRCAVVVPDGVLFNDAKLHTETRKYLIENMNLKKVISLEGDFFMNTGVKSSILYFVNNGTTQEVEFSKIKLASGEIVEESIKKVKKVELVAKGYTLFINKYLDNQVIKLAGIEYKKLGELLEDNSFKTVEENENGKYNFYTCSPVIKKTNNISLNGEYIIIGSRGTISNAIHYINDSFGLGNNMFVYKINNTNINLKYIYYYLKNNKLQLDNITSRTVIPMICKKNIADIEIPIPPLALQQQLVDALDNIYSVIQTNKEQIAKYEAIKKAKITFATLKCASKKLSALVSFKAGKYNSSDKKETGAYPFYNSEAYNPVGFSDDYCFDGENYIILIKDGGAGAGKYGDQIGLGKVFRVSGKSAATSHQLALFPNDINQILYLFYYIQSIKNKIMDLANYTTGLGTIRKSVIEDLDIPIPSPAIQASIVQECEHIDGLIATLTKENERLEADNLIQTILATIGNTTEPVAEIQETNDTVANNELQEKTTKKLIKKKKEVSQKPIIKVNAGSASIEPIITESES